MALSQFTHSVPPSCCSPFIPSSPFPPLAFEFTFYAPLSTSAASFFYSQEPVQRTKNGIVSIDEEVWGEREGKDDETDRFICDAMKSGEGLDKDQKDIMIKGRAGREAEGSEGESGKKRIRDGSESLSSRGVGEGGRVEKRIRVKEPQEENDRGGGVATDVVRSIRRNSRASPSYELNPSLKVDEPILPFRRLIDTSIQTIHRFVNPFEVESYLTSDPVPVSHSHRYFSTILQFMAYVENPSIWETSRGLSVFRTVSVSRLTRSIRDQSPNFRFIREQCPLGSLYQAPTDAGDSVYGNTSVSFNVLEWLWGAGLSNIEELRWVVEKSPLPLFALFLEYVSIFRFIQAVKHTQTRFIEFVRNVACGTPRLKRAQVLVEWLEARGAARWELLFDVREGEGGDERWKWWFDLKKERILEELDEWETRELARLGRRSE